MRNMPKGPKTLAYLSDVPERSCGRFKLHSAAGWAIRAVRERWGTAYKWTDAEGWVLIYGRTRAGAEHDA